MENEGVGCEKASGEWEQCRQALQDGKGKEWDFRGRDKFTMEGKEGGGGRQLDSQHPLWQMYHLVFPQYSIGPNLQGIRLTKYALTTFVTMLSLVGMMKQPVLM